MKSKKYLNERWVKIENSTYEISDLGRLKNNYQNGKNKIVKPCSNGQKEDDYLFYIINGKKHYIHHLVLRYFVGDKPLGCDRDHINGKRQDNRLINLRFIPRAQNRGHKGEKHGKSKLTDKLVRLIKTLVSRGMSQTEIAAIIDVSASTISSIITGRTWQHIN